MTPYASLKVLLVDDEPTMRLITARILRQLGFASIAESKTGRDALFRLAKENFDLVILDWGLPDMTGTEVLSAIRGDRQFDHTRVLMATAESRESTVKEILALGANAYIVKPFTAEMLADHIGRQFSLDPHDASTQAPVKTRP